MTTFNKISSSRLGWSLFILSIAHVLLGLDFNIVYVALPEIGAELGFSQQTLQWVVSAYIVAFGGFLLLGGRISDLIGKRKTFVNALIIFAAASLIGSFANNVGTVILARAIQGLAGAFLFPSILSLINSLFEEGRQRNRAVSIWSLAGSSGLALGSLLGGVLVSTWGWTSVFFVNVPLGLLLAAGALIVIPADAKNTKKRIFDLPGAITATVGVTLFVFVLVQGPEIGWTSMPMIISLMASIIFLCAFAIIESRSSDPLMPLKLLKNRNLTIGMMLTAVFMGTFMAIPYFLTVLFQHSYGFSALQTGFAFLVPTILQMLGSQLGDPLSRRIGIRATLLVGFFIGALGGIAIGLGVFPGSGYAALVPGLILIGLAMGITYGPIWVIAGSNISPHEHGVATAMASTSLQIGGAIGLAVLVAVANAHSHGLTGEQLNRAIVNGTSVTMYVAAIGILMGMLISLAIKKTPSTKIHVAEANVEPLTAEAELA